MVISIIIPAYNAEQFITRCIASIFDTAPAKDLFEVVIVNDGSKDGTLSLLNSFKGKYSNIIVINQENKGVSFARNTGVKAASGDYVLFLDADDELVDGALDTVCSCLSGSELIDMLETIQLRNNGKEEWQVEAPTLVENKVYDGVEAFRKRYVRTNAGGGICRRDFLLNHNLFFPEGITNGEDSIFFALVQIYAQRIVFCNIPLYRIFEHSGSASRSDYTNIGLNYIKTLQYVTDIKSNLNINCEKQGIFDYIVYVLLSNATNAFTKSPKLKYRDFCSSKILQKILPLNARQMYLMKIQARLVNFNFKIYYFLYFLKNNIRNRE